MTYRVVLVRDKDRAMYASRVTLEEALMMVESILEHGYGEHLMAKPEGVAIIKEDSQS